MSKTTTPKALAEYRALCSKDKITYNPSGKSGAAAVRELKKIAACLARYRDSRHQAATNPQYPACHVWSISDLLGRRMDTTLARDAQRLHPIPLGADDADVCVKTARAAHPRYQNWLASRPSTHPVADGSVIDEAFRYRGQHKGRVGNYYYPTMQSAARLSNDGAILSARIGYSDGSARPVATHTIQAGRGYVWRADRNGVHLVRLSDDADYHPTSDEIRAGRAVIVAALRERADARKKSVAAGKRERKLIDRAAALGVYVCIADSLSAGNCKAGTVEFSRRHNLDIRRHYPVEALPRDGHDAPRVALAIVAAQRRQARDLARGFSEI